MPRISTKAAASGKAALPQLSQHPAQAQD